MDTREHEDLDQTAGNATKFSQKFSGMIFETLAYLLQLCCLLVLVLEGTYSVYHVYTNLSYRQGKNVGIVTIGYGPRVNDLSRRVHSTCYAQCGCNVLVNVDTNVHLHLVGVDIARNIYHQNLAV